MEPLVAGLWQGFEKNHAYLMSLVGDLTEDQMIAQPALNLPKPMNHAAWVMSHLKTYRPIIAALIEGKSFDDPMDHPFGMKSSPQSDRSVYADRAALIEELDQGRKAIEAAIQNADAAASAQAVPLERWQNRWGSVGVGVPFLMLNHENMHLGQLSAWRRALGLPSVKM